MELLVQPGENTVKILGGGLLARIRGPAVKRGGARGNCFIELETLQHHSKQKDQLKTYQKENQILGNTKNHVLDQSLSWDFIDQYFDHDDFDEIFK